MEYWSAAYVPFCMKSCLRADGHMLSISFSKSCKFAVIAAPLVRQSWRNAAAAILPLLLRLTSRGPRVWQLVMLFPVNYLKPNIFKHFNLVAQRRLVKPAGPQFYSRVSALQRFKFFLTTQTWKEMTARWVKIIRTRSKKNTLFTYWCHRRVRAGCFWYFKPWAPVGWDDKVQLLAKCFLCQTVLLLLLNFSMNIKSETP